jgi:hypothetical protein
VDDDNRDPAPAGGGDCRVVIRRRRFDTRVCDGPDSKPVEHGRGPADVVALRVRQHDRRQRPDSEAAKLAGDVRLGRAFVHEHRPAWHLEQRGVSLADVEKRDAEPVRA